jgi:trigger factor
MGVVYICPFVPRESGGMVDALVLGTSGFGRGGSNPPFRTSLKHDFLSKQIDSRMAEHTTAPVTELQVEVQEPTSWSRKLSITVPSERVRRARQSVAAKIASTVRMPGFRKGKTPASVVERQFGPHIEEETRDKVIQDAFREALTSSGLNPLNQPMLEHVHSHEGGDLHFDVVFEVMPTLELARTEGFQAERPSDTVTDEDVHSLLERVRGERATLLPLAEGARPGYGDLVEVEITDLDEETEEGAAPEARPFRFELGQNEALPDIEQAIMTLAPGEEAEFTVTYPDDDPDEAQRGKQQRLRIKLEEARTKELPALDDEFAQAIGGGEFETMDALRERVRADLEKERRTRADGAVRDALLQQVLEANPFEVPASIVDRYLDMITGDGPDPEGRRRQRSPEDEERFSQLRGFMRPQAEALVKRDLVVQHIAEREGLRATSDEVDARVEQMAQEYGRTPSDLWVELERTGQMAGLEHEILQDKVFAHLAERSTVTQG